jgi:hypothetical protein
VNIKRREVVELTESDVKDAINQWLQGRYPGPVFIAEFKVRTETVGVGQSERDRIVVEFSATREVT